MPEPARLGRFDGLYPLLPDEICCLVPGTGKSGSPGYLDKHGPGDRPCHAFIYTIFFFLFWSLTLFLFLPSHRHTFSEKQLLSFAFAKEHIGR